MLNNVAKVNQKSTPRTGIPKVIDFCWLVNLKSPSRLGHIHNVAGVGNKYKVYAKNQYFVSIAILNLTPIIPIYIKSSILRHLALLKYLKRDNMQFKLFALITLVTSTIAAPTLSMQDVEHMTKNITDSDS